MSSTRLAPQKQSILEQARDALKAKQTIQDFNELIDIEYSKMNKKNQ